MPSNTAWTFLRGSKEDLVNKFMEYSVTTQKSTSDVLSHIRKIYQILCDLVWVKMALRMSFDNLYIETSNI